MTSNIGIRRRTFLGGVAALGAMRGFGCRRRRRSHHRLPTCRRAVMSSIRNAYVITMEPGQADLPRGDVHVDNGAIVDIGTELAAPGAEVIDGRGFIVMPGLIDTHWHMWTTLLRNMSGDDRAHGYFPVTTALGKFYTPRDMYYGSLLSSAEALHSGTTTVHDWCHNVMSYEHAAEDLRALQETGLRGRFSYGPARSTPLTQPINVADLARMRGDWASLSNGGLLTLGLAWRGVQAAVPNAEGKMELRPLSPDMYRVEYEAARKLDLPVTVHLNSNEFDSGHILALQKLGYVFNGLQVVHALNTSPEEMDILAAAGASVSVSPASELRIGFGLTKIGEYLDHKVNLGAVGRHHAADGQCRHVRDHEARAKSRERPQRKRIQIAGAPGARARDHRGRQGAGPRRPHRIAEERQTGRHHHGGYPRDQYRTVHRAGLHAGRFGAGLEC